MQLSKRNGNDETMEEAQSGEDTELAGDIQDPAGVTVEKVQLKRSITFFGATAILIANIGGSGIFITPTLILGYSGSPAMAIFVWMVGGIVQASLASCAIEVALMFNKAGGPYYFIYYTFGDMAGFVFMWGFILFIAGPTWALGSYTASLYSLSIIYTDCQPPEFLVKLLALWLMVSLIAINCTYMKVVTSIQSLLTSSKVLALVIIIVIGVVWAPSETGQENLNSFSEGTTTNVGGVVMGLFAGSFCYGGWPVITIMGEEVKNPTKTLPRALFVSFLVLILVMMATNFAYYVVISKEDALTSDAVAMLFAERIHPVLPLILSILVSLCCIGTLNVLIMGQPRLLFAAGRNGHMPRIMTMLHRQYKTPWPATFFLGVVATCMLATGSIASLVSSISLYSAIMTLSLVLCLFVLRRKQPDTYRPYKIPLFIPVIVTVIMISILAISIYEKPMVLVSNIVVVLLGVPVYFFFRCKPVKKRLTFMGRVGFYLEPLLSLQYAS